MTLPDGARLYLKLITLEIGQISLQAVFKINLPPL